MLKFYIALFLLETVFSQNNSPNYLFGGANCGQSWFQSRNLPPGGTIAYIAGGRQVSEGELPWIVRLSVSYIDTNTSTCGGFIIDPNWILTAAHCLKRVVSVQVSAGRVAYDWGSNGANEQVMNVPKDQLFPHESFDERTFSNDIGLIRLPQPLRFNHFVQPVCILDEASCAREPNPYSDQIDFCMASVNSAGWGKQSRSSSVSSFLRSVNLTIVAKITCQSEAYGQLDPQQICARGTQLGQDTCQGDSGGPLFCFQNGQAVAIALVSHGPINCGTSVPGVYYRICSHIQWMRRTVSNSQVPVPSPVASGGCQVPHLGQFSALIDFTTNKVVQSPTIMPVGSVIDLSCYPGYVGMNVFGRSVCTTLSSWHPSIYPCQPQNSSNTTLTQLQCSDLPQLANGYVTSGGNKVGARREIVCHVKFKLRGPGSIVCAGDGKWSAPGQCSNFATSCKIHAKLITIISTFFAIFSFLQL